MTYYIPSGEVGLLGMLSIAIFVWLFIFERRFILAHSFRCLIPQLLDFVILGL